MSDKNYVKLTEAGLGKVAAKVLGGLSKMSASGANAAEAAALKSAARAAEKASLKATGAAAAAKAAKETAKQAKAAAKVPAPPPLNVVRGGGRAAAGASAGQAAGTVSGAGRSLAGIGGKTAVAGLATVGAVKVANTAGDTAADLKKSYDELMRQRSLAKTQAEYDEANNKIREISGRLNALQHSGQQPQQPQQQFQQTPQYQNQQPQYQPPQPRMPQRKYDPQSNTYYYESFSDEAAYTLLEKYSPELEKCKCKENLEEKMFCLESVYQEIKNLINNDL